MNYQQPLSDRDIAVSISESPDMMAFGLSHDHLYDALAEITRHLLSKGMRLIYGGDLRNRGFTEFLREVVSELTARYGRHPNSERPYVRSVLAWPVHIGLSPDYVKQLPADLSGVVELVFLTLDGEVMSFDDRRQLESRQPTDYEWEEGLTSMREAVTKMSDARIVLGGRVEGFLGRMPGIAEEALASLRAGQPLYLLGGFGGCARDIAEELGLSEHKRPQRDWRGRIGFVNFGGFEHLSNGLNEAENRTLATTVHVDQAVALILRGLLGRSERL
ncbi:MAG: hypothetical protein QOH49_536 [Acidobacteriota bacterium]|jgi:hypothetical protein|nr:hypothetical protein [Acidobacteriota bacterium]